jgi:hypothetical protein
MEPEIIEQPSLDERRLKIETERLHIERYRVYELEQYRAKQDARRPALDLQAKLAEATVRTLVLLNGGAAVALLAFGRETATLKAVAPSLLWFAVGAALGAATAGVGYLAQTLMLEAPASNAGPVLRGVAVLAAVLSGCAFLVGVWAVKLALGAL